MTYTDINLWSEQPVQLVRHVKCLYTILTCTMRLWWMKHFSSLLSITSGIGTRLTTKSNDNASHKNLSNRQNKHPSILPHVWQSYYALHVAQIPGLAFFFLAKIYCNSGGKWVLKILRACNPVFKRQFGRDLQVTHTNFKYVSIAVMLIISLLIFNTEEKESVGIILYKHFGSYFQNLGAT